MSRRAPRRFPRGSGGAEHRVQHTKQEEQRHRLRLYLEARGQRAEIAGAEIGPDQGQGVARQRKAQQEPESGADDAHRGAFGDEPRGQGAARHADGAEQRELRAPAQHREYLR